MRDAVEAFIDRLSPATASPSSGSAPAPSPRRSSSDHDQLKRRVALLPGQQQMHVRRRRIARDRAHAARWPSIAATRSRSARSCIARLPRARSAQIRAAGRKFSAEAQQVAGGGAHGSETDAPQPARRADQPQGRRRAEDADARLAGIFLGRQRDDTGRISEIGALAAAARTSIYAFRLDDNPNDVTRREGFVQPGAPKTR